VILPLGAALLAGSMSALAQQVVKRRRDLKYCHRQGKASMKRLKARLRATTTSISRANETAH
jgi:hypothetical protein